MSERLKKLNEKIKTLPDKPGIYQYFDESGKIIYIGKAKNLKKRVNSYFTKNHDTAKTRILVRKIHDMHYIVVDNETDALLLENNLIKKYLPKYNIALKDDKTYPWICIKNERFPRVFTTRRVIKDGSKYFGPYPSVYVVNTLLDLMRELYPLRNCNYDLNQEKIDAGKYKVCLEYHIGNCKAPCVGKEKEADYNEYINQIEHIVKGNIASVIRMLKTKMTESAERFAFEEAEEFKQKINALEKYRAKSTVVSPTIHQVDVIALERSENRAFVNYLVINNGTIINGFTVEVKQKLDETDEEILSFVLLNMREKFNSQSKEILIENADKYKIEGLTFFTPQRGDKKHLLDLSKRNAKYFKLQQQKQETLKNPEIKTERILKTIQKDFRLKEMPYHMECFDNSNIQGTNPVSACVVFKNGKPSKKDYRHFNIKTVEGPDDFESMREALYRRYKRMLEEGQDLPQLVIVDGGKGQLSAGLDALEKLGLRGKLPIVGIAKRLEEIFFPGDSLPLYIDKKSESLKVIQHMRNEAHRFGIEHHRNRRSKGALVSELIQIKGIGDKTQEELMKHFKTVSKIKAASEKELVEVVGLAKAKILRNYFSETLEK
ncbi:excinuclease ABC subunit UvrC [Brumimicrobium aurantiacum]|uniref:UvrABC system protein C n=1 Tax=Brumimicrobium aurantiacum TaxID=1737063 RepID=A0A3E1EY70_9FLAO|nr:excinuclease ABC subunit UvrC [Brumimicrobium aurantiacum]RFC54488.1 excinuclease ABC subunit UvrC [Brumimicrobium aurantiacum]